MLQLQFLLDIKHLTLKLSTAEFKYSCHRQSVSEQHKLRATFHIIPNQEGLPAVIIGMSLLSRTLTISNGCITLSKIKEGSTSNALNQTSFRTIKIFQQPIQTVVEHLTNFARMVCNGIFPSKMNERQKTIIIKVNIGAGKTTLANWMRDNTDFLIIPEPIEKWHSLNGHSFF